MSNRYVNAKLKLDTTGTRDLYTCAEQTTAIIKSISVCDFSGSGDTISIFIKNGTPVYILFVKAITGTLELLTAPLVLNTGDILQVTAATANRLDIVASVLEIT